MKRLILLLLILTLVLSITACSYDGISISNNKDLVIGENAFGVHVTVKNMTSENVKFIVYPHADEFGYEGQGEVGNLGIFGVDGLIPGKKKGEEAVLNGSFTLYANDMNGPSVEIKLDGTYLIDDLNNNFETMYFYIYRDGNFTKFDVKSQSESIDFYNNVIGN
jgi:hypothetical protein